MVLNNAPATVASAALREGIPLLVRDRGLYWRLRLVSSRLAEDEVDLVEDLAAIKARSRSLSRVDRAAASTRLRNVLAHDDLEVRYPEIRRFVEEEPMLFPSLIAAARAWLAAQAPSDA